ncbi:MAG: hypothetical protein Tsb0020_12760 [Haliangiales bacterium]
MVHRIAEQVVVATFVLGVALTLPGCNQGASAEQCEKLLTHVVDLQVKDAGESKEMRPELQKTLATQRQKLADLVRQDFIKHCVEELPAGFVTCGLESNTTAEYADCTRDE